MNEEQHDAKYWGLQIRTEIEEGSYTTERITEYQQNLIECAEEEGINPGWIKDCSPETLIQKVRNLILLERKGMSGLSDYVTQMN